MAPNIPPELQVLKFPLKLLEFIGLWGDQRRTWRYYLVISSMLLVFIIPKVVFGPGKADFDSFARSFAELIFFMEVCISIGIFAARRRSFENLVDILRQSVERHDTQECIDEIRSFNRRIELFAKRYFTWISFLAVSFMSAPVATTCISWLISSRGEQSDFILTAELQFYWMDVRQNVLHYTFYNICCVGATFSSAYQSALKGSVILVVIKYGTKLFDLVEIRLKSLGKGKTGKERTATLREIIELHKLALAYTEQLESTVCFVMMNQILNCILIWCLMMFYLSSNFGPNAACPIILFTVLMGEMWVYCVNGNKLTEKAAAVGHDVYSYPWYNESVAMQKEMKLIIQRTQKPTGITAAKFYFVNIERLGVIVQATYSYYLILKKQF